MRRVSRLVASAIAYLSMVALTTPAAAIINPNAGTVTAIHGIPGLSAPVDLLVSGTKLLDFQFGDVEGPLTVPSGSYFIELQLRGTTVLSSTLTVLPGSDYTLIAHLLEGGGTTVTLFRNSTAFFPRGSSLQFRHTANAPPVFAELRWGRSGSLLTTSPPVKNGDELPPIVLLPTRYTLDVRNYGNGSLISRVAVRLNARTRQIIYAVGSLSGGTLTFIVQEIPLSRVRIY